MAAGYDKFFKQARSAAANTSPVNSHLSKSKINNNASKITAKKGASVIINKKEKKSKFPWKLTIVSLIGFLSTLGGVTYLDEIESFLSRVEISANSKASASESISAGTSQDGKTNENQVAKPEGEVQEETTKSDKKEAEVRSAASIKKSFTDEEINQFTKLNARKIELDKREAELSKLEAELQLQKTELDKKISKLEEMRTHISSVLEEKVKADEGKIENLVQMYSSMKPNNAASVLSTLDEDLAVEILGRMKKKTAAEIMNLIKPDKAQILSEKYAGYKRK